MDNKALKDSLEIVYENIFRAQDYLALFEIIGKNSPKLKGHNDHFWGVVQQSALNSAVMYICKLFDETNERYQKHTIPSLIKDIENQLNKAHNSYDSNLAKELSISNEVIQTFDIVRTKSSYFDDEPNEYKNFRCNLLNSIKNVCPNSKKSPLKKMFQYRDKVLAHQEKLDQAQKKLLKILPSLKKMNELATWAKKFCEFINKIFFPNVSLPGYLLYSGKETNAVINKYLEKRVTI